MTAGEQRSAPTTVTVLPDVTGLDKPFDYLVPDELAGLVTVGSVVRVPLHGRRVAGWVLRIGPHDGSAGDAEPVPVERLLPIAAWVGHGPDPAVVDLARWAAHRWAAGRLRPLLTTASPQTRVRRLPAPLARRAPRTNPPPAGDPSAVSTLLAAGGGVWRTTPADDRLEAVIAVLGQLGGAGALLVVDPSSREVDAMADRLRRQGVVTAQLPADWGQAAGGAAEVVIGGRSAVWATVPDLAAVVVLDEHDEAHQEERSPTWHARDVAVERARRAGVPCVLVSPCPTVTALQWSGRRWLRADPAAAADGWPVVEVVDRREDGPWARSPLSSAAIAAVRDRSARVVCVHNATGRARLLGCRACSALQTCADCGAALVQDDDSTLRCPRCTTARPPVCDRCGSTALAALRRGVTRLREELELAAGRPVVAVTASSDPGELVAPFDVYLGTEAVLHRVRDADVVIVLDLDAELLAPRYRAAEQAMALVVRAARLLRPRRSGASAGRLLLQTSLVDHEVVRAAATADPGLVARAEAARRRLLGLPPFGALARCSGPGAAEFAAACPLPSAADGDGVLIRAADWEVLADTLAAVPRPPERLRIEVDPARR